MNIECDICKKVFFKKYNLSRHKINVHGQKHEEIIQYEENRFGFKCTEGCEVSFKFCSYLRDHLKTKHNIVFEVDNLNFNSYAEFSTWLATTEEQHNVQYIQQTGKKRSKQNETVYLTCSRTGKSSNLETDRQRQLKSQGSSKINMNCTSQIIFKRHLQTDHISAKYYKNHYGHEIELQHIRIAKQDRINIATKLISGVSSNRILDHVRDNVTSDLKRVDLLAKCDIRNIGKSFNIDIKEGCRHSNDAVSVNLWIQECQNRESNPVLYYKNQGEHSAQNTFEISDYCLIIMSGVQCNMLKKFGNNVICVDATHGLNAYDFEMTSVLVIDEFGEGFPVAHMFTNKKDTKVYEFFFNKIKDVAGVISANVFMSDITHVFSSAWLSAMGHVNYILYCSWHVDRAWQSNLSKIKNEEMRDWVYKTLKYLQQQLEVNTFEKEFQELLIILERENEQKMLQYLQQHYLHNTRQWAYCYRSKCKINTNMFLESMHKIIKYEYLDGKKIKRLDKTIHNLERFMRDKTIQRLIKLTKGKINQHERISNEEHKKASKCVYEILTDNNNETFTIKVLNKQFLVVKTGSKMCCQIKCTFCKICIHMFECSCLDYCIRTKICSHIHFVCITYTKNEMAIEASTSQNKQTEIMDLAISFDDNTKRQSSKEKNIQIASQILHDLQHRDYTEEENKLISKSLTALKLITGQVVNISDNKTIGVNIIDNSPSNKKILKQKSFFSTKKKNHKVKSRRSKPNYTEEKTIKETLSNNFYVSADAQHDHKY